MSLVFFVRALLMPGCWPTSGGAGPSTRWSLSYESGRSQVEGGDDRIYSVSEPGIRSLCDPTAPLGSRSGQPAAHVAGSAPASDVNTNLVGGWRFGPVEPGGVVSRDVRSLRLPARLGMTLPRVNLAAIRVPAACPKRHGLYLTHTPEGDNPGGTRTTRPSPPASIPAMPVGAPCASIPRRRPPLGVLRYGAPTGARLGDQALPA